MINRQNMQVRCLPKDLPKFNHYKIRSGISLTYAAGISWYGCTDLWIEEDEKVRIDGKYHEKMLEFYKSEGDRIFKGTPHENTWVSLEDKAPAHNSKVETKKRVELGMRVLVPVATPGIYI